jgi:hypothetical protein
LTDRLNFFRGLSPGKSRKLDAKKLGRYNDPLLDRHLAKEGAMTQEATITIGKCGETSLAHIDAGKLHAILLDSLRVRLFNDDGCWFAQGLEIDHFAQGATEDKAKEHFISSLKSTIKHHLEMYGHLKNLTVPAPKEILDEARNAPVKKKLTHADIYDLSVTVKQ